ncbi:hypothetical protein [Thermococcus sp.]
MVTVDINLYDTEGLSLFKEGEPIPWSEIGMTYENIDKLGVWLLMNKTNRRVTIAMRLRASIRERENSRAIMTMRINYAHENELDKLVEKFPEIIENFLKKVEGKGIASYKEPIETSPKWDYLVEYISRTARVLRYFREMPKIKLPHLNYSDPSISERGEMFKFFLHLSRSIGGATFVGIFSKNCPASRNAVMICGEGRPIEELEAKIEAARLKKKRKTRTVEKSEKKGATIVYSVGAFILGALLILGLVYAGILGGESAKTEKSVITPPNEEKLQELQKEINNLQNSKSIEVLEDYLRFANNKTANMNTLLQFIQKDIAIHKEYQTELSKLIEENKTLAKERDKLERELKQERDKLKNLQNSIGEFNTESKYFALVIGKNNITLKPEDIKKLSKGDGIKEWLIIMKGQCKIVANQRAGIYITELTDFNKTLANYSETLDKISWYLEQMNSTKAKSFKQSRDKLLAQQKELQTIGNNIKNSLKTINSCKVAYNMEKNWSKEVSEIKNIKSLYSEPLKLVLEVKAKGINSTLIQGPILDYAHKRGYSDEQLQNKINELFASANNDLELFMKFEELLKWIMEGG